MEFTNEARLDEHIGNEHTPKAEILMKRSGSKLIHNGEEKQSKVVPKIKIRYGPNVAPPNDTPTSEKGKLKISSSK